MRKTLLIVLTVISLLASSKITAQTTITVSEKQESHPTPIGFNGEQAMAYLVKQVEGGPRIPGSPGLDATRKLIKDTLAANGFDVVSQNFNAISPLLNQELQGENIVGIYPKGAKVKFLISAHYDTRPYADQDPDPARRQEPVPGANDGASGVAVLLELSRVLPLANPTHGVGLVFFDIEDHGAPGGPNGFCLGSRHFASNEPTQVKGYQYGINLDMVADAELTLPMEGYSLSKAPKLTFDLWNIGNSLYPSIWIKQRGPSIYDDHMPFLALGKSYIDVIDFDYKAWHTTEDTADKCSAKSLDIVGDTIQSFILN